jgi:hypothetical protein
MDEPIEGQCSVRIGAETVVGLKKQPAMTMRRSMTIWRLPLRVGNGQQREL